MMSLWDERYGQEAFAFGKEPNVFFKQVIDTLKPGKLLVPAAGEGRDAVYAATKGWEVYAFDLSAEGKRKALLLADEFQVQIHYEVADAIEYIMKAGEFDLIALIYFHLPMHLRKIFHGSLAFHLTTNGRVVLEAFNPKQLQNTSGGPKDVSMLMTNEMLAEDFALLHIEQNDTHTIELNEGLYHVGKADVLRLIARREK